MSSEWNFPNEQDHRNTYEDVEGTEDYGYHQSRDPGRSESAQFWMTVMNSPADDLANPTIQQHKATDLEEVTQWQTGHAASTRHHALQAGYATNGQHATPGHGGSHGGQVVVRNEQVMLNQTVGHVQQVLPIPQATNAQQVMRSDEMMQVLPIQLEPHAQQVMRSDEMGNGQSIMHDGQSTDRYANQHHTEYYRERNFPAGQSSHHGGRRFPCELCEKDFNQRSHLNSHVRSVHQKLKPHKCMTCGWKFSKKYDMMKHDDAVHRNIRKHSCPYCHSRFAKSSNLNRHMAVIHRHGR